MQVIPAIDIRRGKCVRLIQGDVRDETIYSNEPVEIAKLWQIKGAKIIHVVDIDGAMTGRPRNLPIIMKIIRSLKINIEVGGGLRSEEDARRYLNAGAKRVILSTSVITSEKFLQDMLSEYREKIVIGVDAKDGYIAIKGWKDLTEIKTLDFIRQLEEKGAKRIIYTDIKRDGVLKGPNFKSIIQILRSTKMNVIVSGGITRLKNIERLLELEKKYDNLEGVIIGKALYTGTIDLKEAVKLAKDM